LKFKKNQKFGKQWGKNLLEKKSIFETKLTTSFVGKKVDGVSILGKKVDSASLLKKN